MTSVTFEALGLASPLLRALADENYVQPTPIQEKAIPHLLQGRDVLGLAQTGTGKTAAFALPILQLLAERQDNPKPKTARALVLVPTRELGLQIAESFKAYSRHLKLTSTVIMGGVAIGPQIRALSRGVDFLVATPGRLLDHLSQGTVDLGQTAFFVMDEADMMLDMGFIRDVRKLMKAMPRKRQSIMFSATMPKEIATLAAEILKDPVRVTIPAKTVAVERIDQRVHLVSSGNKPNMLAGLLDQPEFDRVIVFTRTKRSANRVAERLAQGGIATEAIHGNKSQAARQKALENLRIGKARVLVATDILARGIDVDSISHVINYELPNDPENYVHRIGRTARAGTDGIAISFCDMSERSSLRNIERFLGRTLPQVTDTPVIAATTANVIAAQPRPSRTRKYRPTRSSSRSASR
ncbi:DEAD/DEAH box helicase [Rhodomicrobium lacus]|uniref:DEAD/DEAH box helicase n=1 Tax=Rhodomicrobium lacus TaxID=2498452 RepID=UPI0026E37E74|nr:DEAD/DEAH box helicase [Rhodomicrobium lacus]WKW50000.1 DEAD/DEAH box helicase [Rhodomicrobium lacus]